MPASLRKTLRESNDTAHRALEAQVEGHRLLADAAGPQWRSFVDVLDRWSPRGDHGEGAAAARRTFGLASELLVLREAGR